MPRSRSADEIAMIERSFMCPPAPGAHTNTAPRSAAAGGSHAAVVSLSATPIRQLAAGALTGYASTPIAA
jgi:hypothetical protein